MNGATKTILALFAALAVSACASNGGGAETAATPAAEPATAAAAAAVTESAKCRKYADAAEQIIMARDMLSMSQADVEASAHTKVKTDQEKQYLSDVIATIYRDNLDQTAATTVMYDECVAQLGA